jgi:hypothetical protein
LPEYGGHPMLNPGNQVIRVSNDTLRALDIRGYLKRDKSTGLLHLNKTNHLIFQEAERATSWWYELGDDCSGPNQVVCHCQRCKERRASEADDPHIKDIRTRQIVNDVKARRRTIA